MSNKKSPRVKTGIVILSVILVFALVGCNDITQLFSDNGGSPSGNNITSPPSSVAPQISGVDIVQTEYAMGLLDENPADVYARVLVGNPDASILPERYDNSAAYPPADSQGRQRSCAAWSVAYALKSHQEYSGGGFDESNIFSPAYVFNQINGGKNAGTTINDAMQLIVDEGVCTWEDMPYDWQDYLTQPNAAQKEAASAYRAQNYCALFGVNDIKQAIIQYGGVVTGIPVYTSFRELSEASPVYTEFYGMYEGLHGVCLVGYDDALQAFKLINSWGTDWGIDGYGYVSYDIVCRDGGFSFTMWPEERDTFTISFTTDIGYGDMLSIQGTVGRSVTLPPCTFTNGGARFSGWRAYSTKIGGFLYEKDGQMQYFAHGTAPDGWDWALFPDGASSAAIGAVENDSVILSTVWDYDKYYSVWFYRNGADEGWMSMKDVPADSAWYLPRNQFKNGNKRFEFWIVENADTGEILHFTYDDFDARTGYREFFVDISEKGPDEHVVTLTDGQRIDRALITENGGRLRLHAMWTDDEIYKTAYSANGGEGYMALQWRALNDVFEVPLCSFTNEGKSFAGWAVYHSGSQAYLIRQTSAGGLQEFSYLIYGQSMPDGYEYVILNPGEKTDIYGVSPGDIVYFTAQWK